MTHRRDQGFLPPGAIPGFDHLYPGMPGQHLTPGAVDSSAWAHNPQGTLPKQEVPWPQAYWEGPRRPLTFETPAAVDSMPILTGSYAPITRAVWSTPIYDLAPKLEASSGVSSNGISVTGPGLLAIEILRDSNPGAAYNLFVGERVGAYRSDTMRAVGPATAQTQILSDFTSQVSGAPTQIVNSITLAPPSGYRFWQVVIIIDRIDGVTNGSFSCAAICR